mgnify:CR=1 FL=1
MSKLVFLAAALALSAMLGAASAQTPARAQAQPAAAPAEASPHAAGPQQIEPANALEHAFVAALTNPEMRPVFRRLLMESQVAVALTASGAGASPLAVPLPNQAPAAVYTSPARLTAILGADAPHAVLTGRAAFTRLRQSNITLNFGWAPMLTLEPEDIARYLGTPETPAAAPAPSQEPEAPVAVPGLVGPTQ